MDAFECITTKLEVREFASQSVPSKIRLKILEAARLTGTGLNTQHWRFILVDTRENLKKLAEDSTSGSSIQPIAYFVILFLHQLDENCIADLSELLPRN